MTLEGIAYLIAVFDDCTVSFVNRSDYSVAHELSVPYSFDDKQFLERVELAVSGQLPTAA
jgi:hypothetical protein